ncbi:MAG: NAD/NADP octopine/nopaline dehydrogenase family protein, partial [Candidatus Latescibacteria bacterium]|nr:NAD/NADP octopine/nopaline dehydrogenase family protein [Candidatus Latescibacterota bacterium]
VNVLGSKLINMVAVTPLERTAEVAEVMGHLLQTPVVDLQHFLHMTLHPGNQLLHPGIMYAMFGDWDGTALLEPPLFYEGVSDEAIDLLQQMSDELLMLRGMLEAQIPDLRLPFVLPLHASIVYGYGEAVRDPSSLQSAIATNKAYTGIRTPMVQKEGGWVPDWSSRFFWEDIPHGLVVLRGLADLAGASVPVMDQVLLWAQDQMRCVYLVDGQLNGHDVASSGAPRCYGIANVDDLITD